tara:strand:+ start:5884 stop:6165 length:282 start_codon:yes stop_codon:yes gene_type:complete
MNSKDYRNIREAKKILKEHSIRKQYIRYASNAVKAKMEERARLFETAPNKEVAVNFTKELMLIAKETGQPLTEEDVMMADDRATSDSRHGKGY